MKGLLVWVCNERGMLRSWGTLSGPHALPLGLWADTPGRSTEALLCWRDFPGGRNRVGPCRHELSELGCAESPGAAAPPGLGQPHLHQCEPWGQGDEGQLCLPAGRGPEVCHPQRERCLQSGSCDEWANNPEGWETHSTGRSHPFFSYSAVCMNVSVWACVCWGDREHKTETALQGLE